MSENQKYDNRVSNSALEFFGTLIRIIERAVIVFFDGMRNAVESGTPSMLGFFSAVLPLLTPAPVSGMTAISLMWFFGWEAWQAITMAVALEVAGFVLWVTLTEILIVDGWSGSVMQYFFGGGVFVYQSLLVLINGVLSSKEGHDSAYVWTLILLSMLPALGSISYGYRNVKIERKNEARRREKIAQDEQIRQERRADKKEGQLHAYNASVQQFNGQRRPLLEKACPGCGETFKSSNPKAVTCSERCKKRVQRDKSLLNRD